MRASVILLIFVWVTFEEASSRKLWSGFRKNGGKPEGNPKVAPGKDNVDQPVHEIGTASMFGKIFDLGGKRKKVQSPSTVHKALKVNEDFAAIERAISALNLADFADDTQVILEEGDNDTSVYRHIPTNKRGSVVFRRPSNDAGKGLIVLTRSEDHLRIGRTKRTYVVLKQNPDAPDRYFVLYAYIRQHGKSTEKSVEWDLWDARGKTNQKNRPFGWTDCKQTSFVSCKATSDSLSNNTPEYEDEDDMDIPDDGNDSESAEDATPSESNTENSPSATNNRIKRQAWSTNPQAPFSDLVKSAAKILERTMADAKFDYYLDLRDDPVEAKLVGLTIDIVTKGVTALSVSEQVDKSPKSPEGSLDENSEIRNKVLDALEASVKHFAGATSVLGLLVGGIDNLDRKNDSKHVLGDFEAKLGKKFLENILIHKGGQEASSQPRVNPNPAELLEPSVIAKLSVRGPRQQGRGILGGSNQGGLLGNLGAVLGLSGLLGRSETATTKAPVLAKKPKKKKEMMGEGISQKALATALVKSAQKEKAKLYANLPPGSKIPEEEVPPEGLPLKDMPIGGLAMIEGGDMVHKLPSGGFVLLPKAGGLIHMTAKEIAEEYGEPVSKPNKNKASQPAKQDPGLIGGLGNVVSGLLNNVGTVLKGGGTDEVTGKSKGIIRGLGGLVSGLLNDVNQVVNGDAGKGESEEEIVYEYEDDAPPSKGRSFAGSPSAPVLSAGAPIAPAAAPIVSAAAPIVVAAEPVPKTSEPITPKPFSFSDCVTRRPGKKTWYDPIGLYPDPSDPCYFAPAAVSNYHSIAPTVALRSPYAYSYPFYPYFGRRRKRSAVPDEAIPITTDVPTTTTEVVPSSTSLLPQPDVSVPAAQVPSTDGNDKSPPPAPENSIVQEDLTSAEKAARHEKQKKGRGWLFGNGSQQGNGCTGILGIIGSILGNRKKCDVNTDTLTVIGKDGKTVYAQQGDGSYSATKIVDPSATPLGVPGGSYAVSSHVSTYVLPPTAGGAPGVPLMRKRSVRAIRGGKHSKSGKRKDPSRKHQKKERKQDKEQTKPNPESDESESSELLENDVPAPVTRSQILARMANQLIHEIAATAVGVQHPPPVVLPGKTPIQGKELIDHGLDVLQFPPQQGRSLGEDDTIKTGLTEQLETDLFSNIGWLSQAYTQQKLPEASDSRKSDIFIGFGTCPYVSMASKDINTAEKAVDFYLNLMRTGCDSSQFKTIVMSWINEGCIQLIQIKESPALQLQRSCKYLSKPKLTKQEIEALSKVFELAVFSQAYSAELSNKEEYSDGISKTVRTVKDMVILGFKRGQRVAPLHLIKLTRCIVRTVKTAFTKSLQDLVRYQSCAECTKADQDSVSADVKALLQVIEYIIAYAEPSNVDWQTYHQHIDKPKTGIDKKLKHYFVY